MPLVMLWSVECVKCHVSCPACAGSTFRFVLGWKESFKWNKKKV